MRVMLHVPGNNFEHQIDFTGHCKYADDTLYFCKIVCDFFPTHVCFTNHTTICTNGKSKLLSIRQGTIPYDDALPFKPCDAP